AEYPDQWDDHDIIQKEGESLIPLISDHTNEFNTDRVLYWEHAGNKAVRDGQWKLEQVWEEPWELYNMAEDRCETNNLIAQYPERAKKMEQLYNEWANSHMVVPVEKVFKYERRMRKKKRK